MYLTEGEFDTISKQYRLSLWDNFVMHIHSE